MFTTILTFLSILLFYCWIAAGLGLTLVFVARIAKLVIKEFGE